MGFFSDYVKPTTHTVRHVGKNKPDTCINPNCNKKPKDKYGSCGSVKCSKFVAGAW